jgi:hypothetical protein
MSNPTDATPPPPPFREPSFSDDWREDEWTEEPWQEPSYGINESRVYKPVETPPSRPMSELLNALQLDENDDVRRRGADASESVEDRTEDTRLSSAEL